MKRATTIIFIAFLGSMLFQCNEPSGNNVRAGNPVENPLRSEVFSDQIYTVDVIVSNLPDQFIYLVSYQKASYSIIDSILSVNGSFYFTYPSVKHPGTYRIYFGRPDFNSRDAVERQFIEFLWWQESFTIFADFRDISTSVTFENSAENDLLGEFREYETRFEEKMGALFPLFDRYPEEDDFLKQAGDHFLSLQLDRDDFIVNLTKGNPDLYASVLIKAYRSLILKPDLKGDERMDFLRYHFFDKAPIDQPDLIFSPVYNFKIIEYLSLYKNQSHTYSQQEDAFIEATDIIMANVSGDADVRSFVVEYLLDGFNSFQMERVQTYIADNYVDETCTTDLVELAMQRVEGYRKMEIGAIASDFRLRDINNKEVILSKLKSDYTVVIFWASHCEHCLRMLPKIKEWYLNERPENVEVVAISIDTVKLNWTSVVNQMQLPWINAHEPLGWEGRSSSDYNIYATPTIFILDRKRAILDKPLTYREMKRSIEGVVK